MQAHQQAQSIVALHAHKQAAPDLKTSAFGSLRISEIAQCKALGCDEAFGSTVAWEEIEIAEADAYDRCVLSTALGWLRDQWYAVIFAARTSLVDSNG